MVYMSSWRTRLHCPQLWPREKEVCLRENCFRENRLRESPPGSCRGRLCSTKRTCETFAVKAWKDSSVEAQRSLYSTSTRCEQMPTSSASSSNVEISSLKKGTSRPPGDTCSSEKGSSSFFDALTSCSGFDIHQHQPGERLSQHQSPKYRYCLRTD